MSILSLINQLEVTRGHQTCAQHTQRMLYVFACKYDAHGLIVVSDTLHIRTSHYYTWENYRPGGLQDLTVVVAVQTHSFEREKALAKSIINFQTSLPLEYKLGKHCSIHTLTCKLTMNKKLAINLVQTLGRGLELHPGGTKH